MDRFMKSLRQSSEDRNESDVPSSSLHCIEDSLYIQYKKCTLRFKETLQSMVPPEIFQFDNVSALMSAAEYVAENDLVASQPQLLDDLKVAISARKRVAMDIFDGGDEGHSYFISVLAYCWSVLAPKLPKQMKVSKCKQPATDEASTRNRFEGLFLNGEDSEDDEEDDLEADLPTCPMARPEETETSRLPLEELISGSDRSSAILFLVTLNELMRCVSFYYTRLKTSVSSMLEEGHPHNSVTQYIMQASVATNFAIQEVASLEELFVQDYPHLNTVYRLQASLLLVSFVPEVSSLVSKRSPLAAQFSEKDAIALLGDALECAFRHPPDAQNRYKVVVKEFLKRWKFPTDSKDSLATVEKSLICIFANVFVIAKNEVHLLSEQQDSQLQECLPQCDTSSHSWCKGLSFLCEHRSIWHTIRLLQGLSGALTKEKGCIEVTRCSFSGPSWKQRQGAATEIQDMDSLLMEDILPNLINMCREGMLSYDLPYEAELFAAFSQIKMFANDPETPVTWSLAFTVHSILTAILEVEGSYHPFFIAEASRQTYGLYFERLVNAQRKTSNLYPEIEFFLNLKNLPVSNSGAVAPQEVLAVWNPVCAGSFLSFIAYYLNVNVGAQFIDADGQLRMTLHLFNALQQLQAVQPGQIKSLDVIFQIFEDCKAVWEGPLPTQGHFLERWLIASGMKSGLAVQTRKGPSRSTRGRDGASRKVTPILAEDISKSFRRVCCHDFNDALGTNHRTRPSRGDKWSAIEDIHVGRAVGTWNAMQSDVSLLGTSLIAYSYYLNQLCLNLLRELGLLPKVEQARGKQVMFCMSAVFAKYILEPLDKGDELMASRCAKSLDRYFKAVSPDDTMWFTPCIFMEEE
jgi:hypothetical protein